VRVALHGDKYYFEVGRDRERDDTIFFTRIEAASDQRQPHSTPRKIDGEFRLWPAAGDPPPLESADALFNVASTKPVSARTPEQL
jgi:hypothetical protein